MPRKYRPSNGSEGEAFMGRWCEKCADYPLADSEEEFNDKCAILPATFATDVNNPEYPAEWITDEHGPRCTAFRDAETAEPRRAPDAPGQLVMFGGKP